jgi:Na+-driven multidrug efflux pump
LTNIISNGEARGESSASLGAKTYGALLVSLALSLAVALVLNLCPETLLAMLNTPTAVMATATAYTKVRSIGMPAAYVLSHTGPHTTASAW